MEHYTIISQMIRPLKTRPNTHIWNDTKSQCYLTRKAKFSHKVRSVVNTENIRFRGQCHYIMAKVIVQGKGRSFQNYIYYNDAIIVITMWWFEARIMFWAEIIKFLTLEANFNLVCW